MTTSASVEKYPLSSRIFHWVVAVLALMMIRLGGWMSDLPESDPNKYNYYHWHESFGVVVLILAVSRIWVRSKVQHPELPDHLPAWNKTLAHVIHRALLALIVVMPVSGILMSTLSGYQVPFFFFEFPKLPFEAKAVGKIFGEMHEVCGKALAILILFHIAGVLKEVIINKKNIVKRMT